MPDRSKGFRVESESAGFSDRDVDPSSVTAAVVEDKEEGSPLGAWVERFGGFTGVVTDAFGRELPVSFERWRNADKETTRLKIELHYAARRS